MKQPNELVEFADVYRETVGGKTVWVVRMQLRDGQLVKEVVKGGVSMPVKKVVSTAVEQAGKHAYAFMDYRWIRSLNAEVVLGPNDRPLIPDCEVKA